MLRSPEKKPMSLRKAREEAAQMREKIESGEARDYNEAEQQLDEESKREIERIRKEEGEAAVREKMMQILRRIERG